MSNICILFQEEQNRGKPNWEHLNDELHVLITVEDTENRATLKLERAVDEVKKLLTVVSSKIYKTVSIRSKYQLKLSLILLGLIWGEFCKFFSEGICLIAIWRHEGGLYYSATTGCPLQMGCLMTISLDPSN